MRYNKTAFENDCEQAARRKFIDYKSYVDAGGDVSLLGECNYVRNLLYSWQFCSRFDSDESRLIYEKWRTWLVDELTAYQEDCRREAARKTELRERNRREKEREEENQRKVREAEERRQVAEAEYQRRIREEKARRRRVEEELRRRAEEEACRKAEEEKHKKEEERRQQENRNREELDRIKRVWKENNSATQILDRNQPESAKVMCPSCGAMNKESSRFCTECGNQIQDKCPLCGKIIRLNSRFCKYCGAQISKTS